MMTLLDEVAVAERRPDAAGPTPADAVVEIARALLELGGSAHREAVIDRIAIQRGQDLPSDDLREELVTAFDRHRHTAEARGKPAMLDLPFGEGSRRWSLGRDLVLAMRAEPPTPMVALLAARVPIS